MVFSPFSSFTFYAIQITHWHETSLEIHKYGETMLYRLEVRCLKKVERKFHERDDTSYLRALCNNYQETSQTKQIYK